MRVAAAWCLFFCFWRVRAIPLALLYEHDVPQAQSLPQDDDVSSREVALGEPFVFFGETFESVFVNSNGFLSFQTEIPHFINIQFPLSYPIIAPFYSNVDTRRAGTISYFQTDDPGFLHRATELVHEAFINSADFQATSLFIVTWEGVGYFKLGQDKVNTYQVILITDGVESYVEFLYPENGIQWIQGTGDESGLPDARAQAGFVSPDGKLFTLPGSGTEQVANLERWSNIAIEGQFIYKVDGLEVGEPDASFAAKPVTPLSCAEAPSYCHVQAQCVDYESGFCCECNPKYYGNGRFCIKKDVPLRVNGKVNGKINDQQLAGLDLQSYIAMSDGRAYTAISKIPESVGYNVQSLQILGGVIGYLFAKPVREALNGYQLTGGVFNHTATITFLNTSQIFRIKQKFLGLDVFDQLRLESDIQGEIPHLPQDAKVTIDEYEEDYTLTNPGTVQTTSHRTFRYIATDGQEYTQIFKVDQTFLFDYCKFKNGTNRETWKLKVGKNFISYESREQIIRFGLSNKIAPLGDYDPCEDGQSRCTQNSVCVVENDSYRCVCNPGYQYFYTGTETVCGDVNECQVGQYECDYNAECINTVGSYTCQCNQGFEGDGFTCARARSCANAFCDPNAECAETSDGAVCRCVAGFTGDGQNCQPTVGHSCYESNNCSPFGYCSISPETNEYYCACQPGYVGDGYTCELVETTTDNIITTTVAAGPEQWVAANCVGACWCPNGYRLQSGTKYCLLEEAVTYPIETTTTQIAVESSPEAQCLNATTCFCPTGFKYIPTDGTCVYIARGPLQTMGPSNIKHSCNVLNNCDRNATCIFSEESRSYQCICNGGFEGNGYTCEQEVLSCTKVDNCDPHATCTYDDAVGRSRCICNPGFEGDGYRCSMTATCTSNQDCTPTEDCIYSAAAGQYECLCKEGYNRDSQHQCVQVTGSCGGGICAENAECLFDDDVQTYYCSCKAGYVGDGITECRERVVGCDTLNNCGTHATCQYQADIYTYKCICNDGFFGDGLSCYAERNCHIDPGMCDPNAACLTDADRKYVCQCNPGYLGNGTICREISRYEGNFLLINQGMATHKISLSQSTLDRRIPIQIKAYQTAVGLDADCLEGRFYWSDISGKVIRSALFNGSAKTDFIKEGIGSPEGLAIDWVSRNIYWTDSTLDTIEVANLDSKRRRTLFDTDLVNPRGIAVHPQRGKIFWTDWNRRDPKIEWANADGTGRQIFLKGDAVGLPNSLTVDYDTDQLCYTDAGTKKIECVHIDTRQRQTIAVNCTYPFGITVTDRNIYWSDWISKKIESVDKYTLKRLPAIQMPLSGSKLFGLVAVANSCPQQTNVCQYYRNQCPAEHICLPNGLGSRRCVCSYRSDAPDEPPSCQL